MSEQIPREKPFHRMHHLSLVVHDIDATVSFLQNLGIGPWFDYPPVSDYVVLEGMDRDEFARTPIKCTWLGPGMLQAIAPPPGESQYRKFLDRNGPGVFHLGFEVEDIDAAETTARSLGLGVLMRGRREDRSGFAYFDNKEQTGVTLLLRQSPR